MSVIKVVTSVDIGRCLEIDAPTSKLGVSVSTDENNKLEVKNDGLFVDIIKSGEAPPLASRNDVHSTIVYGAGGNMLTAPIAWGKVEVGGNTYVIPMYSTEPTESPKKEIILHANNAYVDDFSGGTGTVTIEFSSETPWTSDITADPVTSVGYGYGMSFGSGGQEGLVVERLDVIDEYTVRVRVLGHYVMDNDAWTRRSYFDSLLAGSNVVVVNNPDFDDRLRYYVTSASPLA